MTTDPPSAETVTLHCKRRSCRAALGELVPGTPGRLRVGGVVVPAPATLWCGVCGWRNRWPAPKSLDSR